ncbi:MAG: DUF1844 domain-containing protein [candidate division Zixibacteria bacterium]|nr:DUF1844 domain-containing protein [candidate division Zixibacteria bacterium]
MSKEINIYFIQLVLSLSTAAMQQMGKIMNPMTGKVERDLAQAHYSIELLRMLREKTEGNLSDDELKTVDSAIYDAQMNYLEESKKEEQEKEKPEEKTESEDKEKQEEADNSSEEKTPDEAEGKEN